MRVSLHTLGCKVNYAETAQLKEKFEQLGYTIANFGDESEVVVINTCSVTNHADIEARKIIRRAKRISPNSYLAVLGCYAQLKPVEIASISGVDGVFGQKDKFKVPNLIHDILGGEKTQVSVSCIEDLPFDAALTTDNEMRTRAFLKMQDGCNYFCSFCTIPYARGNSRSMAFEQIPSHINKIIESGYKEVVISGINLGDYKTKEGKTFTDVVKFLDSMDMDLRVRISSIEPNLLNSQIIDIVSNSNVFCPHFHIPLQSGSPEILKKMKRRYKTTYYQDLIHRIKDKIPNCSIGIDVIEGFPGETESHFQETFNFIKDLPASYLHVFTYSERDNTPAASYDEVVPVNIRKERTNILRNLSLEKLNKFYKLQIGAVRTVIPETYIENEGAWTGWTENYVRVKFKADSSLPKDFIKIKITESDDGYVKGEIVL
jgi:threonylcarbamoyladenosine tRNA methylthiotransferase MtaB